MDCSLTAPQLESRTRELKKTLIPELRERELLDDGVAFELAADQRDAVIEFVEFERRCCGFADFAIIDRPGVVRLEIRGRDKGSVTKIRKLFAPNRSRELRAKRGRAGLSGALPPIGFAALGGLVALVLCELPVIIALTAALLY